MTFFGQSSEYRPIWEGEILQLVYKSEGNFSYWDVYHMPVSYRKGIIKWIIADIEEQNEKASKEKGEMTLKDMVNSKPIMKPDFITNIKN